MMAKYVGSQKVFFLNCQEYILILNPLLQELVYYIMTVNTSMQSPILIFPSNKWHPLYKNFCTPWHHLQSSSGETTHNLYYQNIPTCCDNIILYLKETLNFIMVESENLGFWQVIILYSCFILKW